MEDAGDSFQRKPLAENITRAKILSEAMSAHHPGFLPDWGSWLLLTCTLLRTHWVNRAL